MKPQIVGVVMLIGTVSKCLAACQNKKPMSSYSPDIIKGKFYLIAENQKRQLYCVTAEAKSPADKIFDYIVTFQATDGSINTIKTTRENIPPPGTFNGTAVDGPYIRQWVVLGGMKGKVHIFYSCDSQSGNSLVWIFYYNRVSGLNKMDPYSRQVVDVTLAKNNIPKSDLHNINNNNCNN